MKAYIIIAEVCDYDGCSTTLIKGFKSEEKAQNFTDSMNQILDDTRKEIRNLQDLYDKKIKSIPEYDMDPLSNEAKIFYKKRMSISNECGELRKQIEDEFTNLYGIRFEYDLSYEYEEIELED